MDTDGERPASGNWFGNIIQHYRQQRSLNEEIEQATERIVEIADPKIKQASRYKKILHDPVAAAKQYCSSLIDAVPGPVLLSRENYHEDPMVKAVFISPEQLEDLLRLSPSIVALKKEGHRGPVVALMTMLREEKTIYGYQKEGETVMRDVAQRAVTYSDHRVVAPSTNVNLARQGIVERGLEVLATVAMEQIVTLQRKKSELQQQKEYLKASLKILGGKSQVLEIFASPDPDKWEEYRKCEKLLAEVEAKLLEVSTTIGYPEQSLGYLNAILKKPEDTLAVDRFTTHLNWMNVIVDDGSDESSHEITLAEFSVHEVLRRAAMLVTFSIDAAI